MKKLALVLISALLCLVPHVRGVTLTGNEELGDGVLSGTGGPITSQGDRTFWWNDKQGDGSMSPATAGLDMAGHNLTRVDGNALILNLNDGSANGVITNGNSVNTVRSANAGAINISGAADISVSELRTVPSTWADSGNISVYQTGNFQAGNLIAWANYRACQAGSITMNGGGPAAGAFLVSGGVYSQYGYPKAIMIRGYQSVTVGSGGILNYSTDVPFVATISGGVIVTNIGTGGISIAGGISSHFWKNNTPDALLATLGPVSIAGGISTRQPGDYDATPGGNVWINAGGSVDIGGTIDTSCTYGGMGSYNNSGAIAVTSTASSVTVNNLSTWNNCPSAAKHAGDATITAYSNLQVLGNITLQGSSGSASGTLRLTATGAGSTITLASLDLGCVNAAVMSATNTFITGSLVGFPTNTPASGKLNASTGQTIYYYPTVAANAYLTNGASGVYTLAGGGQLRPNTTPLIDNVGASNVMGTTVILWGNVSFTGSAPTTVYVCWGTNSALLGNTNNLGVKGIGAVSLPLEGLVGETTYYYRFLAVNSYGSSWAPTTNSFQTGVDQLAYRYKMKITFSGYSRSEPLTNFPALVVLGTDLPGFSYGQFASAANGYDLRFADESGALRLNHEIENWATNANSHVWVQAPVFTNNCAVWAYWGRQSATNRQPYTTNGATWDSGFSLVQHMANSSGTAVSDSSQFNRASTIYGTYSWQNAGQIGPALRLYGGLNDDIELSSVIPLSGTYTISVWFHTLQPTNQWRTLARGSGTGDHITIAAANGTELGFYGNAAGGSFTSCVYSITSNSVWNHIAAVASIAGVNTSTVFYVNGVNVGSVAKVSTSNLFCIGNYQGSGTHNGGQKWAEYLDEFRNESVARSSNWVWACYMNQASNRVFNGYGLVSSTRSRGVVVCVH